MGLSLGNLTFTYTNGLVTMAIGDALLAKVAGKVAGIDPSALGAEDVVGEIRLSG